MAVTFKQYMDLMNLSEDASEEQINEIFGAFFGGKQKPEDETVKNDKLAKLKAEREKLLAARKAKSAELDKKWAAVKSKVEKSDEPEEKKVGASTIRPTRTTSAAAQGRAAERDWLANM